ncbi:MAG: uroporphyrinogen decarboxylase family protein [Actinomycetota bacterium]
MNHRDRVILAIDHKEGDRIPLDLWSSDSRITNDLYIGLCKKLGLEPLKEKVRPGTTAEYVDYRISDYFEADFRHPVFGSPKNYLKHSDAAGNTIDEWGIGHKYTGITKHQISYHPLSSKDDIGDISRHKWPAAADEGRIEKLIPEVISLKENTDYYISTASVTSGLVFEFSWYLRGMDNMLMDLYINKKYAHALIEKVSEKLLEIHKFCIDPIRDYIDAVEFASDFGTQKQAFIPKKIFDEFYKEPMKMIFDEIKKDGRLKVILHSCGAIKELIPSFIEAGVDVLSSLQPSANDMDSAQIKREFGRDIGFRGGVDIQNTMAGSQDVVIAEAKKRIKAFAPGGGYIFGPSNHFLSHIPVENIITLYETAKEFGKYPIDEM